MKIIKSVPYLEDAECRRTALSYVFLPAIVEDLADRDLRVVVTGSDHRPLTSDTIDDFRGDLVFSLVDDDNMDSFLVGEDFEPTIRFVIPAETPEWDGLVRTVRIQMKRVIAEDISRVRAEIAAREEQFSELSRLFNSLGDVS